MKDDHSYARRMERIAHATRVWYRQYNNHPHTMPALEPKALVRPAPRELKDFNSNELHVR